MKSIRYIVSIAFVFIVACRAYSQDVNSSQPNIVIIYLDDLGYGDVSCYGATALSTPNIDALAAGGIKFTNGYASSATCTPSRYALLTGLYPWKNKQAKILPGTAPLIIDTTIITLPKMLKQSGYHTALVGKWHLGLGSGSVNWNGKVSPGPNETGFDEAYYMAATQDRVPTVYLHNGIVDKLDQSDPIEVDYEINFKGQPTGIDNPELCQMMWHHGHNGTIVNGIPRIGFMKGGDKARWKDVDMADHFLLKAKEYIRQHQQEPFFLYYAMQQPHVPRTPHPRFVGSSGLGPRGDVIIEADWCVGELIKTLDEAGILENTLIVFSSDNGPVLNDGYFDEAIEKLGDHQPAGNLRGGKYSLFEAGTRVPFIVFWKGTIEPKVSDALVCQLDLMASLGELLGEELLQGDGQQLLDVFMGQSNEGREHLILEANSRTAYRKGDWVMIPPYDGEAFNTLVNIELGNSDSYQLYNLSMDPSQRQNLARQFPNQLTEMIKEFISIRGDSYNRIEKLELK